MKKFLAIIAIAAFAVACNNSGDKTETTDTVPATTVDTTTPAPVSVDTTAKVPADTTAAADTAKKM